MRFRNYFEVRDWLEGFIPEVYGKEELGLARIENLLALLGNPEKKFKSVHVAGTSGKGTTCWYIAALLQQFAGPVSSFPPVSALSDLKSIVDVKDDPDLRAVGSPSSTATRKLKIGLHISPHLVDIRERMQVFSSVIPAYAGIYINKKLDPRFGGDDKKKDENESLMPMDRFITLFDEIKPVVDDIIRQQPQFTPSYFEILVAATFLYFAQENVDVAVVEVGLGGRLDATNVLMPEVCVITNIGLDHTEILGDTVEKIAYEKAGIIKKGVPVVTGAMGKALKVIEKVGKEKGAELVNINTQYDISGSIEQPFHQGILLAQEAVKLVLDGYAEFSSVSVKKILHSVQDDKSEGLAMTNIGLPGRLEEIEKGLTSFSDGKLRGASVILDGAHNPDKIRFLIEAIKKSTVYSLQTTAKKTVRRQWTVVLVIAFKAGKNWKKMVDLLLEKLPVSEVIATKYQAVTDTGKGSAVEPNEIAKYVSSKRELIPKMGSKYQVSSIRTIENSQEAVFEALNSASLTPGVSLVSTRHTPGVLRGLVLVTGSLYLVGEARTMWKLPTF